MKEMLVLRLKIGFYFTLPFAIVSIYFIAMEVVAVWFMSGTWAFTKLSLIHGGATSFLVCAMSFLVGITVSSKGKDDLLMKLETFKHLTSIMTFGLIKL